MTLKFYFFKLLYHVSVIIIFILNLSVYIEKKRVKQKNKSENQV